MPSVLGFLSNEHLVVAMSKAFCAFSARNEGGGGGVVASSHEKSAVVQGGTKMKMSLTIGTVVGTFI